MGGKFIKEDSSPKIEVQSTSKDGWNVGFHDFHQSY